ncbi:MAG: leucine-rich repeat domain-containing protein [Promethearchaeia archaeon]
MTEGKEFTVNEHLTLRLEDTKSVIYVDGERFRQCAQLVLQIPLDNIKKYHKINSIDEAAEINETLWENRIMRGDRLIMEEQAYSITPEQEFWGHCSNLQVWAQHDYDSRLIHRSLAFPLLKRLSEVGDLKAKRVFREEIVKRILDGNKSVFRYLIEEGYFRSLKPDDFEFLLHHRERAPQFAQWIVEIPDRIKGNEGLFKLLVWEYSRCDAELREQIKEKAKTENVSLIDFDNLELSSVPESIGMLSSLRELILTRNNLIDFPDSLEKLTQIEKLDLSNNDFRELPAVVTRLSSLRELAAVYNKLSTLPESIANLKNLERLILLDNKLTLLPDSIGNLSSLIFLSLNSNRLDKLTESFANLTNLKVLQLYKNHLSELPQNFGQLHSLKHLTLAYNQLSKLPKSFDQLSLRVISLTKNEFEEFPEILTRMAKLKSIGIGKNFLNRLPNSILNLTNLKSIGIHENRFTQFPVILCRIKSLRKISIEGNPIDTIPKCITKLKDLKKLRLQSTNIQKLPHFLLDMDQLEELFISRKNIRNEEILPKLRNKMRIYEN